jgi:hypothetical protein
VIVVQRAVRIKCFLWSCMVADVYQLVLALVPFVPSSSHETLITSLHLISYHTETPPNLH